MKLVPLAVLVISTFGLAIVTVALAVTSGVSLSCSVAVFVFVLPVIDVVTLRLSWSVPVTPGPTLPMVHDTVPFAPTEGALVGAGEAEAYVMPAGIGSLTTTPGMVSVVDGLRYWSV